MSRFNYSSALGDNSSPFAPNKHYIAPAAAIGIGVGAASLIGSGINAYQNLKSQANTNETNYKIWQEQLAAQKENWKREQDNYLQNRRWQLEDIENQRRYESPAAQKARYLAAGINPYLANSFGQSQAVSPPPSAPNFSSPASPSPMQYTPVDLGLGIAGQNAANAYFSAASNETNIAATKQHINNETLDTLSKVHQRNFENANTQATMNKVLQDIRYNEENWAEKSKSIKYANDLIQADILYKNTLSALNVQAKELNIESNNRAWIELRQFIAESKSRISLNGELGKMYDSQANLNYSQQDINIEIWKDKKFYNSKIEEIYKNNKGQADAILRKLNYEATAQGWKDFVRMFQGFIPFGGMYQ